MSVFPSHVNSSSSLTHGDADVDGGGVDALHARHEAAVGARVAWASSTQVEPGLQGAVITKLDLDPEHLMIKFSVAQKT